MGMEGAIADDDLAGLRVSFRGTVFAGLAAEPTEVAALAYFDPNWRLLGVRHARSAASDAVNVPIRAVAADALVLDCVSVVMAHNHPSGDPSPSAADRAVTRRLARALDALDVELFDHLVFAADAFTSFRARGWL